MEMEKVDGTAEPVRRRRERLWPLVSRHRSGLQMAVDVVAWAVALLLAMLLRFDFAFAQVRAFELPTVIAIAGSAQVVVGLALGLYLGRRRYGSFEEVSLLAGVVAIVTVVGLAANLPYAAVLVPRSAMIGGGLGAFVFMGFARYAWRLYLEGQRRPTGEDVQRLLVFGAGEGAAQVVTGMVQDPGSPYLPVALLDDDPAKRYLSIKGVSVVGTRHALAEAAERHRADALLVAVPSAGRELINDLNERAKEAGLEVRVVPSVSELLGGRVRLTDIRPVTEADLLGRHPANVDPASIADYVTGRRVLVTGAGGSIGSELCRQLRAFGPASLVLLDRDESGLHATQLSLDGRGLLDSPSLVVADIRDRDRLFQVFQQHRPEVVFHAAALKHLPLLQMHPSEAWKTNVVGTENLLEVAEATDVAVLVNISTDKAADPTSVLGYTKRICERLTAEAAGRTERRYVSVRFGNVLGSRGSMLTTFERQIEDGGPITVTHPDVTRYFMTVEEAVALTIQAGALGEPGEVLVLDMGKPVRIEDVARRLRQVRSSMRICSASDEDDLRPHHPLISHVPVPAVDEAVRSFDLSLGREQAILALKAFEDDPSSRSTSGAERFDRWLARCDRLLAVSATTARRAYSPQKGPSLRDGPFARGAATRGCPCRC
jgi:FlaA1/EpsC-like NDP-sugar epimerase